jgi:N-acetylmuramoyl-L-alanine amidase CwlA
MAATAFLRTLSPLPPLAFQNGIGVPKGILQHNDWSGKDCPSVLRAKPNGWANFLEQIKTFRKDLTNVPAAAISMGKGKDHHRFA